MANLVTRCPSCSGPVRAARLACSSCGVQLDGDFSFPPLLRLDPEDLRFVIEFVRASGSLKAMSKREQLSYPTIRNRLDAIIARLEQEIERDRARPTDRRKILDELERGEITAAEAARRLRGDQGSYEQGGQP